MHFGGKQSDCSSHIGVNRCAVTLRLRSSVEWRMRLRRPGRVEDPDACMRPKGCATTISLTQPQNQDISSAPVAYSGRDYWFMSSSALV